MYEIQDVKDAFGNDKWQDRVAANPRRIYGFLLASDEHNNFLTFIKDAWRTLHTISGDACDIFIFEQRQLSHEKRFANENTYRYQILLWEADACLLQTACPTLGAK
jgi:hypothetical protein